MTDEIENITMAELFALPEKEMFQMIQLLRCLKPKNKYVGNRKINKDVVNFYLTNAQEVEVKSIQLLPYGQIVLLKKYFLSQTADSITKMMLSVFEIPVADQLKKDVVTFFPLLNFILNGIQDVIAKEANRLNSPAKGELIMAGIERMNEFGENVTIDSLSGGDLNKWYETEQRPWQHVFMKLCMDKVRGEIHEAYGEICREQYSKATA